MTEHDEQHIIAKQPTLLERLERELANTQAAYKKACDIAAEAKTGRTPAVQRLQKHSQELTNLLCEKEREIAEARAREGHVKNFIAGRLHTLSRRAKKPLEYTSLNRIVDLLSEALAAPAPEPTTSEAEPCTVRWCKSGLPATRRATDCHDDGAWNVAICQQCFDAFDLGKDGEDLPGPEEARRLLRAAQQQESGE